MDQQKRSTFVSVLAWVFIAMTGLATLISILQNIMISVIFPVEEMNAAFEDAQAQEQIPAFFGFIFSNIRLFFFSFLVVSGTTFVSAIGLLKRKNWARIIFIVILGLGIGWNIFSLIIQNSIFASMGDIPYGEIYSEFSIIMNIMKVFSFIFAMGISYLFGWIIYMLTSYRIRAEFIPSLQFNSESLTYHLEPASKKKRLLILSGAVVLTIAIGVFYFSTGNIPTVDRVADIQKLAATGDATRLSELLREHPELANPIGQDDSWTPLHAAVCNGNVDCTRLLIEAGADIDVQSCNQSTPLHYAAEDGNIEIVELLLRADADPNLKDTKDKTPLDWAIWNNHEDVVDLLKQYSAKTGTELTETN